MGTYGDEVSDFSVADYAITNLAAPSSCEATCSGSSSALVTWVDNSATETGFQIYMNGGYTASVGAGVEQYTKTGLTPGETYTFKVRAINSLVNSSFSNTDSVYIANPPAKPTNFTVTISGTTFILSWQDNSTNETGFKIFESVDGGDFSLIYTTEANVTSYDRTGRSPNVLYAYKVKAYNADGGSLYSNTVQRAMWTASPTAETATLSDSLSSNLSTPPEEPQEYESSLVDTFSVSDSVGTSVQGGDNWAFYLGDSAGNIFPFGGGYYGDGDSAIAAYYQSRALDFADQYPQFIDTWKTVSRVYLDYVDLGEFDITVGLSADGGNSWVERSKAIGDGDNSVKTAVFDFWKSGRFFSVRIKNSSSDQNFQWVSLRIEFEPHADWFSVG